MGAPAADGNSTGLSRFLPVAQWLPAYSRAHLKPDMMAAVTMAAFSIPELMAFAKLAGLPPEYGLFAGIFAGIMYFLFGTIKHLIVGPAASQAVMFAGVIGVMVPVEMYMLEDGTFLEEAYFGRILAIAMMTSILVGIMFLIARLIKLGWIINLIPIGVFKGFIAGVGLTIIVSQMHKLFGIESTNGAFFNNLFHFIEHVGSTNMPTLGLAAAFIAILVLAEWKVRKLPGPLVVVILSIVIMLFTDLNDRGVEIIGDIPSGLAMPMVPEIMASDIRPLLPLALALFIVSFVETMSMGRMFQHKYGYKVDAEQELVALGGTNVVVGFFQGFPVSGSFSRTLLNDHIGAKTQLSGLIVAVITILVVVFFTEAFYHMPEVVLAVLIIVVVYKMVDFKELHRIRLLDWMEFNIAMVSFGSVLVFGVLEGVLIGVIISFLVVNYRISSPHIAVLGRVPGTDHFTDLKRHPQNETFPGVLVVRVDAPLIFANSHTVKDKVLEMADAEPSVHTVVMDLQTSPMLDITASDMLVELDQALAERGTDLRLAEAIGDVQDMLRSAGVTKVTGPVDHEHDLLDVVEEVADHKDP
jgi:high affinity sulfate transporter 1